MQQTADLLWVLALHSETFQILFNLFEVLLRHQGVAYTCVQDNHTLAQSKTVFLFARAAVWYWLESSRPHWLVWKSLGPDNALISRTLNRKLIYIVSAQGKHTVFSISLAEVDAEQIYALLLKKPRNLRDTFRSKANQRREPILARTISLVSKQYFYLIKAISTSCGPRKANLLLFLVAANVTISIVLLHSHLSLTFWRSLASSLSIRIELRFLIAIRAFISHSIDNCRSGIKHNSQMLTWLSNPDVGCVLEVLVVVERHRNDLFDDLSLANQVMRESRSCSCADSS